MKKILLIALVLMFCLSTSAHAQSIWADILNDWDQGPNAQYPIPSLSPSAERDWVETRVLGESDFLAAPSWEDAKETFFNLGDGRAIYWRKDRVWAGRLAFVFKNYLDQRFMRKFQVSGELSEQ